MRTNCTPHLVQDMELLTGGGLKDGWSYLMPHDRIMLYEEVMSHFADEVDGHIKEQTEALKNLYVSGRRGSFLQRRNTSMCSVDSTTTTSNTDKNKSKCDMLFVVKRGQKVVGCVTYDDESGCLSDMAIRPSAEKKKIQLDLIEAVVSHAGKADKTEISMDDSVLSDKDADVLTLISEQGYVLVSKEQDGTLHFKATPKSLQGRL